MLAPSLALLALTLGGPCDAPVVAPEEFRSWFEAAGRSDLRVLKGVASRAAGYRYVFVGGFRGEGMRGYFAQNAQILRSHGVPKRSICLLAPSSHQTVEEYSERFAEEFRAIADRGTEPIVVIAHSRGGCDVLAFALRNPDFIRDHVSAMFLVQAPFGGTGLADYVMGEGPPLDRAIRLIPRLIAQGIGALERALMDRGQHGSLAGLTREASHAYWSRLRAENPSAVDVVGPRTFYVEAETSARNLRLFLRATSAYLDAHYGPNDGVVARGDQSLPGLGTSLGVFDAGHSDLTRKALASRSGKRARKALTLSILMAVGRLPS